LWSNDIGLTSPATLKTDLESPAFAYELFQYLRLTFI
jgi:hypothetical protein